jgi:hypothetical protein
VWAIIEREGAGQTRRGIGAAAAALALLGTILYGCTEDGSPPAAPAPTIISTVALPAREGKLFDDGDSDHRLFSLNCMDGILTIATTKGVVDAELPCDRSLPPDVVERFAGRPIEVRYEAGPPGKLFLMSIEAGSVEFTVGRVWVRRINE